MFKQIELWLDRMELEWLGLEDDEIEGYFAFFYDNGSNDEWIQ